MIILKSKEEIHKMARANQIVAQVLALLKEKMAPGITTNDLDQIAETEIRKKGGVPTFIGYRGFPKSLCVSVNEEVVHGIPGDRVLNEGDIVGIDCGVTLDGFVGDSAITVAVGQISEAATRLMKVTQECLERALEKVVVGNRIGDIGHAIQAHAEAHGYSVVREFVGHGIGRHMHEDPQVPNYGTKGSGPRIKEGLVLAIEPMINEGTFEVKVCDDQWTVVTADGKLSAHFEHSVACTEKGPWILSARE